MVEVQLPDTTKEQREQILKEIAYFEERDEALSRFTIFLTHWVFLNRETGEQHSFETLWEGQEEFAQAAEQHPWVYALKAGKLGFTELECAFDGFRALGGPPNARVHLFSRTDISSQDLLQYVRYGIEHLPEMIRPEILGSTAGGSTMHSLKLRISEDDTRTIIAYASAQHVSIDQSCAHAHVDELARMPFPRQTWQAVYTTISPAGGTCHIVTRGAGEDNFAAEIWKQAKAGSSKLYPLFLPWSARPDRDRTWYEQQAGELTTQGLKHFAPETEADALAGDDQNEFIPPELWDRCKEDLELLIKWVGPKEAKVDQIPLVVALDAAVTGDCFGIVAISRHPDPERSANSVAVRAVRKWDPPRGGSIDFKGPESFLRMLILGGCAAGHWVEEMKERANPLGDGYCEACASSIVVPPHNVVQVTYDPYQLEALTQDLRKQGLGWFQPFSQMNERLIADSELRDLIVNRRIAHDGNLQLREHVLNAAAKLDPNEDHRLRIVKKAPEKKIDLAVATSMGARKCLYLLL